MTELKIVKVSRGFIVTVDNKESVYGTLEDLAMWETLGKELFERRIRVKEDTYVEG